ncbi:MAG: alpha/beta hydrolase [Oscillospiraceae bacterium]|jgi:acetyl esterase/lipase|nr:alpha/beta hydrolase [Oscillospiraceae bacterium]
MKLVKAPLPNPDTPFEMPLMDTSAIKRKWIDVAYTPDNPHPARKLDIYLPNSGDGPFPVIICIHGGAFTGGSKDDFQVSGFVDGVAEGFAVVSVEQRLCHMLPDGAYAADGQFPHSLFDFKAAIRFLRVNAERYRLDPNRFATAGDSAGGYHAIMAAATAAAPAMYDGALGYPSADDSVQAVVDWFGCGDLIIESEFNASAPPMALPDGSVMPRIVFEDVFLGLKCVEHQNLARFASPEIWITDKLPPVLLQHGAADEIVTVECSRRLAKKIADVCGPERVTFDEFPGWAHGDPGFYSDENLARVFNWLKAALK